jgi:chromosome segregation ATPase
MRSIDEIDLERSKNAQELLAAEKDRDAIETEIISRRRQIDTLRIELRDFETALIKAKCVIREKKARGSELDREFWSTKNNY